MVLPAFQMFKKFDADSEVQKLLKEKSAASSSKLGVLRGQYGHLDVRRT